MKMMMNSSHAGVSASTAAYTFTGLKRKADGRLIAPVVGPDSLTYLDEEGSPASHLPSFPNAAAAQPSPEVVVEEELLARRLERQIEDEKAKRARLEWCLREILAERDVLLRHREDEARRKRQEELRSLGLGLSLPSGLPSHLSGTSRTATPPPASTPPPSSSSSFGQATGRPVVRPMPHALHITPRDRLATDSLPDFSKLPFLSVGSSRVGGGAAATAIGAATADGAPVRSMENEVARLLGVSLAQPSMDELVLPYQQPTKRARLGGPPSHPDLPFRPVVPAHRASPADVNAHQVPKTSLGIGEFCPSQHLHRHACQGHRHHQHHGSTSGAGCESPIGALSNASHQCVASSVAAMERGASSSLTSSPVPLEPVGWQDSLSSSMSTSFVSPPLDPTLAHSAQDSWSAHLVDDIDYDDLLTSLASGL